LVDSHSDEGNMRSSDHEELIVILTKLF